MKTCIIDIIIIIVIIVNITESMWLWWHNV